METVELIGPAGRVMVTAREAESLLRKPEWRLVAELEPSAGDELAEEPEE